MATHTLSSTSFNIMTMRCRTLPSVFTTVCSLLLTNASAVIANTPCPGEVATQQSLAGRFDEWTGATENTRHPLVSIRLSEGNPSEMVWLMPTTAKRPNVQYWALPKSDRPYFISCGYGSTSLILFRQLPKNASKCTVWIDKDFAPAVAIKYECG